MSSLSIEINNCSAVLYQGTKEREAHAGSSASIQKWINEMQSKHGNIHVSGWHRLKVLREKEEAAADIAEEQPVIA